LLTVDILPVNSALFLLYAIEALDKNRRLTKLGNEIAILPVDPSHARALLASREHGCTADVLDIISLLSASSGLFFDHTDKRDEVANAHKKFLHNSGDHFMMLNVLKAYMELSTHENRKVCVEWCRTNFINERTLSEALRIRKQLRETCTRMGMNCDSTLEDGYETVLKCLLMGTPQNCAQVFPEGGYRQILGKAVCAVYSEVAFELISVQPVKIHPSSSLLDKKVPTIMYNELVCLFGSSISLF
jgi:HrpA-like RNA helicase